MINIKADILKQVVCESYKFGLNEEIQNKCNYLYEVIQEYNNIKPVAVANQIIVDIFTEAYEKYMGILLMVLLIILTAKVTNGKRKY